ncbi:MAG: hypothetical protein FJ265_02700 [Planctomycetes bacterium]|nr:hypothetical protein [Planctomycetota bacterium]
MTSIEPPTLQHLRALLHDTVRPPGELVAELAEARWDLAGDGALAHELLAAELRWLAAQPAEQPAVGAAVAQAVHAGLGARVRALAVDPGGDPAVLFELADAEVEARAAGDAGLGELCAAALARGLAAAGRGERLRDEANERTANLLASVDGAPLLRQIERLRRSAELLRELGARTGCPACRRCARRLQRAAADREQARRLEGLLGRRGVAAFENANFVLLLLVLAVLVVEATVALPPGAATALRWLDGLVCAFFVAGFGLEWALHPSRFSWFLRRAPTDLLPALPSVLLLLPGAGLPGAVDDLIVLRLLRLLRATWAVRYVQALRPLLRVARLLLFVVRGLDGLARRFAPLLNREFVFVPAASDVVRKVAEDDRRDVAFEALRREQELAAAVPADARAALLVARAAAAAQRARTLPAGTAVRAGAAGGPRDVPIERAVETLWALRPQDLARWLGPGDVLALDRALRVLCAAPLRWLPVVRAFAVHPLPGTPEERVVALARRAAEWLAGFYGRLLFYADLHGIVTGPQILDRVASAMVKATQRPAVRLLLFGGLFLLVDQLIHAEWLSRLLSRIVATPLIVLGSICLVFLTIGRWLKHVAGEAADAYRMTSEAHFLSQLDRLKLPFESVDLPFLAQRVFAGDVPAARVVALLRAQLAHARTGVPVDDPDAAPALRSACSRLALLYQHFLDGAPLHESDVKTTEQLLANPSLENLRARCLGFGKRDRKRLRKLRLDEGSLFGGPYLWFSFITESVAVEAAKRIDGYNRFCLPLDARAHATPAQLAAMQDWLVRRADPKGGRTLPDRRQRPATTVTTEFNALDFVAADPERDRHLGAVFGAEVLAVLQKDRRTMVREIFGTRPVHRLPRHQRSFNPLRFYQRRLSHGRVLLAPLLLVWRFLRSIGWFVARVAQIVREVRDPELAMLRREIGEAPFGVALRKIHRMKAPGLIEAVRMRLQLDPVYSGAAPGWTAGLHAGPPAGPCELERDLAFLHVHERMGAVLRERAAAVRGAVAELHAALGWLPSFPPAADAAARAAGELAATSAWIADAQDVRTLLFAERWRADVLPGLLRSGAPGSRLGDLWRALRARLGDPVVERWHREHGRDLPRSALRVLRRAWAVDLRGMRRVLTAWAALPAGSSPADTAIARLHAFHRDGVNVRGDLLALRAVQSLAVLDVRNHRTLVFRAGGYAEDGEDERLATGLP